jgi:hypothetical protein
MSSANGSLHTPLPKRIGAALAPVVAALALIPSAGAAAQIYWWQQNMSPGEVGFDRAFGAHNRTYNELYFGQTNPYRSEIWEVTPAGDRHFDKWCYGNCFQTHPGYFYDYPYCANRDGRTHFVNRCMSEWPG